MRRSRPWPQPATAVHRGFSRTLVELVAERKVHVRPTSASIASEPAAEARPLLGQEGEKLTRGHRTSRPRRPVSMKNDQAMDRLIASAAIEPE